MIVVVAEKPSVARDIAAVLGATTRRRGYLEGAGYRVTWAVGHLLGLGQPHELDPRWRAWRSDLLPMLPEKWRLVPRESGRAQLTVVARLLRARDITEVVCATDAGREGELIFRYIIEWAGCRRVCKRLWISSLTPDAIRQGMRSLRPLKQFDALAAAARARSQADWLFGMNLSRAYTLARGGEVRHVGRVKTPTLALVVGRDRQIDSFVPAPYREVTLKLRAPDGVFEVTYVRQAYDADGKPEWQSRLPVEGSSDPRDDAQSVLERAGRAQLSVGKLDEHDEASPPPLLFDLTELQRTANRLWGWTAQDTLTVAQELYERHKLLTYPRTDAHHLSTAIESTLADVARAVAGRYGDAVAEGTGARRLSRRFVADTKVTDHHAIIPTARTAGPELSGSKSEKLYDLVCRRFLMAWHDDAVAASTVVDIVARSDGGVEDIYRARGRALKRQGWRVLELRPPTKRERPDPGLPTGLHAGLALSLLEGRIADGKTRPPNRHTDATLLSAMETAGASLQGELSDALRDRGLGTPATRAGTIEELVAGGYLRRAGKALESTTKGRQLVAEVDARVASAQLTGELEAQLRRVERGELPAEALSERVRRDVATFVQVALGRGLARPQPSLPRRAAQLGCGAAAASSAPAHNKPASSRLK